MKMSPELLPPKPPCRPIAERDARRDALQLMRQQRRIGRDDDDDRALFRRVVVAGARRRAASQWRRAGVGGSGSLLAMQRSEIRGSPRRPARRRCAGRGATP